MKRTVFCVEPSCISINREMEYIREAQKAYNSGKPLPEYIKVTEKSDCIVVTFYR